jgi:succinylarginine dihydrolase
LNGLGPLFPARQTLEASSAIARLHRLDPSKTVFARQNPSAVDAGVFHNDVISVGNENVFLYHSEAFADIVSVISELRTTYRDAYQEELIAIEVSPHQVSVSEAVRTYLFNSQLVTLPDESMCLIAPLECSENEKTDHLLQQVIARQNPIRHHYIDIAKVKMGRASVSQTGGAHGRRKGVVHQVYH